MKSHPLLPSDSDLAALRMELRRTAEDLRRVARSLRRVPSLPRADEQELPLLRFIRGGLWHETC